MSVLKEIKTKELYESPMKYRNEDKFGVNSDSCECCYKPTDEKTRKYVHMGTDWEAYNTNEVEDKNGITYIKGTNTQTQGFFAIGSSCAKKMGKSFVFDIPG